MKEFIDDEQGYLDWIKNNPNGYILNSKRNISPSYLPLHRASCTTITQYKKTASSNSFTSEGYKKLCFSSEQDAVFWMSENHRYTDICSKCKPELYLSDKEYRNALDNKIAELLNNPMLQEDELEKQSEAPKKYITLTTVYNRSPYVIAKRLSMAQGVCDDCQLPAPFMRKANGVPFLEVHHVIPLSDNGEDTLENTVALCPNCHRRRHYG